MPKEISSAPPRVGDEAPQAIIRLFRFPYQFFGRLCGNHSHTLMDIASGDAGQKTVLDGLFRRLIFFDNSCDHEFVKPADIRCIPMADKSVEVSFCFETVEHLDSPDQNQALRELERVTQTQIVIGSIDEHGEDHVEGVPIFKKKNDSNPYHLRELNSLTFPQLIEQHFTDIEYYQSWPSPSGIAMRHGLWARPLAYCNYAMINL